jgi:hypothetical protein
VVGPTATGPRGASHPVQHPPIDDDGMVAKIKDALT